MVCNIYDTDLTLKGTIFTWVSLVWDEYYNEVGEAQIELQLTDGIADLVKIDRYLSITGSNHLMLIKSISIEDNKLVANAKDALCVLDERVATDTIENEPGESAIRKLVSNMSPWPCFELGEIAGIDGNYTGQMDNGTVLEYVLDIAQSLDIGLSVTFSKTDKKITFECYKPESDPDAKYSSMYGNMSDLSYSITNTKYKNVAIVKGTQKEEVTSTEENEDGEPVETTETVEKPVYVTVGETSAEGANRREIFVDESSESMEDEESLENYKARLGRYGMQKLGEQILSESITFLVDDTAKLGSLISCTVPEFGLKLQTRIIAVKMTSQNNKITREAEVGTPIITRRR